MVLIVCKAITVWTQVIFTVFVSNRVSPYKALAWLCSKSAHKEGRALETDESALVHKQSAFPHAESSTL